MGRIVTVSAKVRKELKEKLQKHGINISQVVRRAIESEVKKIEEEELRSSLAEASKVLEKVKSDVLVEVIRRSREEKV